MIVCMHVFFNLEVFFVIIINGRGCQMFDHASLIFSSKDGVVCLIFSTVTNNRFVV